MQRRSLADQFELDVTSLLEDDAPRLAPAVCPSRPVAPAAQKPIRNPRGANGQKPDRLVLPKATAKRGRDAGRDEMLSEYLSSLGRIPLLTAEEEREMAARFEEAEVQCWRHVLSSTQGRALVTEHVVLHDANGATKACAERLRLASPSKEDVLQMAQALRELDDDRCVIDDVIARLARVSRDDTAVRSGGDTLGVDEARRLRRRSLDLRNRFVRANLRLVVSVARRFHHYRLPLIDLIQEGNLGLIKSVHRFDHRRGFRFSTYAHWWIRQAIERAIMNKGAQVRLPVHIFDARREVARATRDLQAQLHRDPTVEELATEMGTPVAKLHEILRAVPREPQSLDDPVGDDEDRTLGEIIADSGAFAPDDHVIQVDEKRWLRRALTRLSPMEVDILTRRFGLDADDDETLEAIGKSYNLSRERVRQIQVQSLRKIQGLAEQRMNVG